jgi:hypothetical protein
MPAFGRRITEKNIPKKANGTSKNRTSKQGITKNSASKNRTSKQGITKNGITKNGTSKNSITKKSISIQTNQPAPNQPAQNETNAFQKKLSHSLANLIPVLEAQITKKIEAKYLAKIHALENEIKRVKEEHSSFLYRNELPTIHENTN